MKKIITFALFDKDADVLRKALDVAYMSSNNPNFCKDLQTVKEHIQLTCCEHKFEDVLLSLFEGGDKK